MDARSDIFGFGSLFFEMLTGRRPFQREGKVATLSAILNEEPPPLSRIVSASAALEQIVTRCLRKDPGRRFQHMDELKASLERGKHDSAGRRQSGVLDVDRIVHYRFQSCLCHPG